MPLGKGNQGFYVVVTRIADNPAQWSWTIMRRNPPMGARIVETGFASYGAALSAGRVALEEFLKGHLFWKTIVDAEAPSARAIDTRRC